MSNQSTGAVAPASSSAASSSSTAARTYIIDKLFPTNEIHLISGPSGSGKSTLMLQILDQWRQSLPVFGLSSHPCPFQIISCDRPADHLASIMARLSLDPAHFPHFSVVDAHSASQTQEDLSLERIVTRVRRASSLTRLLIIDGFTNLCPGKIIDHNDVSKFLRGASQLCHSKSHNLTIIGIVYASKSQPEGAGPLSLVQGCSAWPAHTSGKIIIEPQRDRESELRTIHLIGTNVRTRSLEYQQDPETGLFTEATMNLNSVLDKWLETQEPGSIITTAQIIGVGEMLDISKRSCERWIQAQLSLGTLVKVGRGEYVIHDSRKN